MKIALVIEHLDALKGGRETYTCQVAAGLAARGQQATVICEDTRGFEGGAEVRAVGSRGVLRIQRLRSFVQRAQAELAGESWDITHAMLPVPGARIYQPHGGVIPAAMGVARRRWGVLGLLRQGMAMPLNFRRRYTAALECQVVNDPATTCLCVSRLVARQFAEHYGRTENVRVIFNGVNTPPPDDPRREDWRQRTRFELGLNPSDTVFLTIATNLGLKGVPQAIRAFSRWFHSLPPGRDGRLIVVGREEPEGYLRLAGAHALGDRVQFVGPTREVFRWYAACDAFMLLSWYDSCSLTVLEAVRWGIPCITTEFNGAAEALEGGAGIVVRAPSDLAAVAGAMGELADPQRRAERSLACIRAAPSLSLDRHLDELVSLYKELAARS